MHSRKIKWSNNGPHRIIVWRFGVVRCIGLSCRIQGTSYEWYSTVGSNACVRRWVRMEKVPRINPFDFRCGWECVWWLWSMVRVRSHSLLTFGRPCVRPLTAVESQTVLMGTHKTKDINHLVNTVYIYIYMNIYILQFLCTYCNKIQ